MALGYARKMMHAATPMEGGSAAAHDGTSGNSGGVSSPLASNAMRLLHANFPNVFEQDDASILNEDADAALPILSRELMAEWKRRSVKNLVHALHQDEDMSPSSPTGGEGTSSGFFESLLPATQSFAAKNADIRSMETNCAENSTIECIDQAAPVANGIG